jgi:hypothetical protein
MRTQKEGFRMRLFVLASALILLTACGWTSALAQANPQRDAPVGHRQLKASERTAQEQQQLSDPDKKLKELDDALAKKLEASVVGVSDLRIYHPSPHRFRC